MRILLLWSLIFCSSLVFSMREEFPSHCKYDEACLIELPGSQCADGTPSYYTVTRRRGAEKLLIYVRGGGACWSKDLCDGGYARPLTRVAPNHDWNHGTGIKNAGDPLNPFRNDYTIVTVPYCPGDLFIGNREVNYGTSEKPYIIRHRGYQNMVLTLKDLRVRLPNPEAVVLAGSSAGGIGAFFHLKNLVETYPTISKYVLSDAGLPFEPPFIREKNYSNVIHQWGVENTFPVVYGTKLKDLGDVVEYNTKQFPDVPFGLVGSYGDVVMTLFAAKLGAHSTFTAVRDTLSDVADNRIGKKAAHQRVYYLDDSAHTYLSADLKGVNSLGENLGNWISKMLSGESGWGNIRPDRIGDADRFLGQFGVGQFPISLEWVKQWYPHFPSVDEE